MYSNTCGFIYIYIFKQYFILDAFVFHSFIPFIQNKSIALQWFTTLMFYQLSRTVKTRNRYFLYVQKRTTYTKIFQPNSAQQIIVFKNIFVTIGFFFLSFERGRIVLNTNLIQQPLVIITPTIFFPLQKFGLRRIFKRESLY